MSELSQFEAGWLIGILEGEGTFLMDNSQRVAVDMTDMDTIRRLAGLLSRLLDKPLDIQWIDNNRGYSMVYRVSIHGENARTVMRLVVRYMSQRRRRRIWQCLNGYKEPRVVKLKAA